MDLFFKYIHSIFQLFRAAFWTLYGFLNTLTLSLKDPCAPLYLMAIGLICPIKIGLPKGRDLRATVIAALSLRVS
jgi:hypothetical protein